MHLPSKSSIRPILLLAVILPALLAPSLHRHEVAQAMEECESCLHHLPHEGHLASDAHMDDCLVCHFLTCNFIVEKASDSVKSFIHTSFFKPACPEETVLEGHGSIVSRGPPMVF